MEILKIGSSGDQVKALQLQLIKNGAQLTADGQFGPATVTALKAFQLANGLTSDGIAGPGTYARLFADHEIISPPLLTLTDMEEAAAALGLETATIQAVRDVETGGRSGFLPGGRPVILFEGHIFWKQLVARSIDPQLHLTGNEDILYPSWTTAHYKYGAGEHDRLEKAKKINVEAAISSASWGLFQIMGFNHSACGFSKVTDYVDAQYKGEKEQLMSFVNFIRSGNYLNDLRQKNWAGFAKKYNGSGYAQNKYDSKLAQSYLKHLA